MKKTVKKGIKKPAGTETEARVSMMPVARDVHFFAGFLRMLDYLRAPTPEAAEDFYGMLLDQALAALGYREGALMMVEAGGSGEGTLRLVAGKNAEADKEGRQSLGKGGLGKVAASLEPALEKGKEGYSMALPLKYAGELLGVMKVTRPEAFQLPSDLSRARELAHGLGAVLAAARALSQREEAVSMLAALTEASTAINSQRELRGLLASVMREAEKVMQAEASSVFLVDEEKQELFFEVATGPRGEEVQRLRLKMGEGIAGWVAVNGSPLLVPDVDSDPRFARRVDEKSKFHTRDILCVPLKVGQRVLGVIQVLNHRGGETFKERETAFFEALASMSAVAIENATLYTSLEKRAEQLNAELISANQELGLAKSRMESILYSMEDGVVATDRAGRVTLLNRVAQIFTFGLSRVSALGRPLEEVIYQPKLFETFAEVKKTGKGAKLELAFSLPLERTYAVVLAPIKDAQGIFNGMVAVFRDVTDLKELDRMKTDFLNTVSHELRTPMTSIRAFSELMAKRGAEPEKVQNWAGIINEETERLGRLIDDLLDVSRIEAGKKMKIKRQPVLLKDLAEKVRWLFSSVSARHPFGAELEPGCELAELDPDRILQVVSNFITNAIKYSPQGGPVTLRIKQPKPGGVRFEVSDKGMGISEKDRVHLFEKFYRVDASNTQNIRGTGLGLAIAKHIVEMHGGEIGVESKSGEGSTFWFEIPEKGAGG